MTSRERVKRCITFKGPDRIPMTLPAPFPNDILLYCQNSDPDWKPSRTWEVENGAQWEDEWGNVWKRFDNTTRGEVIEGALKDWSDLDNYKMPTYDKQFRYEKAKGFFDERPDNYHLGALPGFPFAIMRYMRLMEVFLADVLLYPDEVMRLQRMVIDHLKRCIDCWKWAGADGFLFAEDWGTQERLLISPALWRKMFKPGFEELINHAHSLGIAVFMHSCGYIKDIIPDLRDIGLDVLQLDQPELSGIDWLRETVGGRMTIWSPVDIQGRLPKGNKEDIQAAAKEYIEKLGSFNGGYIAGCYVDYKSLGIEEGWQVWGYEAFMKYADSVYRK
ncbi:MAG: uroporphyrinogen decarboxylase family protein [Armatimonadota bacterium]